MIRYLEFTFPDGSRWRVPARLIAEDRAQYYAKTDPDTTYDAECAFTLGDRSELTDWFFNNMDPEDVQAHAEQVQPPEPLSFADGVRHDETHTEVIDA